MNEPTKPAPAARQARARPGRGGMNKTGARILGGFFAALIAWAWKGWGEPATGVPLESTMATALGGACIVITEWVLVKEPIGRAARGRTRPPAATT